MIKLGTAISPHQKTIMPHSERQSCQHTFYSLLHLEAHCFALNPIAGFRITTNLVGGLEMRTMMSGIRRQALGALLLAVASMYTLTGCSPEVAKTVGQAVVRVIVIAATTTTYVAVAVTSVNEARAANLDVERKQLAIEAIKKNGEKTTASVELTADQVKKIQKTAKVTVKLDDGSETELPVTIK
jgi:hypothetical protein